MAHVQTYEDAAVARVVLERGVGQVDESERSVNQSRELLRDVVGFVLVPRRHAVVVEGDAVDDGHEE